MPYWRLSGFYLFYFATLGALLPYWGLYLKSLGFDARAIGSLIAIIMATKIVAPNVWGWIADHANDQDRLADLCLCICRCLYPPQLLVAGIGDVGVQFFLECLVASVRGHYDEPPGRGYASLQ